MALTKAEKAINEFNNEIAVLALSKIDKEKLSTEIARDLLNTIRRDARSIMNSELNVGRQIKTILTSENSKTGRNYQGLLAEITQGMIDSIRTPPKEV